MYQIKLSIKIVHFRYTNLVGAGLPRAVAHDTEFHGYQIPSGAMILIDMGSVLSDPSIWKDPENFRPSRFVDEESGTLRKNEEFIAFSMGKCSMKGVSNASAIITDSGQPAQSAQSAQSDLCRCFL